MPDDIDLKMDKKIADAKLLVTEKRLNFVLGIGLALLTVFGIILPLIMTLSSANRVDQAIEKMDQNFNELAGKQLRKPKIACFVDGHPLENSTIIFNPTNKYKTITVKNIGDGTADFIRMRIYTNSKDPDLNRDISFAGNREGLYSDRHEGLSDKPGFDFMHSYYTKIGLLPAQDEIPITFHMQNPDLRKEDASAAVILMIFYGEPQPVEVPFTIQINNKDS